MTELLNDPAAPISTMTAPPCILLAGPDASKAPVMLPQASGATAVDRERVTAWVASAQDHDEPATDKALTPAEVASLSLRRLRMLVTQAYTLMDTDYPPSRTVDRYQVLVDELERRAEAAEKRHPVNTSREKFRDNSLSGRFELFTDGHLVAYMQYRMTGGNLTLIMGNELPGFRDQGAATTLMRNIVLDAHKRRLNLIPRCPMAYTFLTNHPQYQQYISRS